MKIAYLHQYFNTMSESGSIRSDLITQALQNKYRVVIITLSQNRVDSKEVKIVRHGQRIVIYLPYRYDNKMPFYGRTKIFIKYMIHSYFVLFRIKPGLVYASSTPLTIAIPALFYKFVKSVDYILEIRDQWPAVPIKMGIIRSSILKYVLNKLEYLAYKNAVKIVALSPGMKSGISEVYPNNKTIVVTNFCYHYLTTRYEDLDRLMINLNGRRVLLYPGTVGIVNEVEWLVNLSTHLSSYVVIIIGDGNRLDQVIDYAKEIGVYNSKVFFLPKCSKSQIMYAISQSVFVVSTVKDIEILSDNSANKVFDSLSFGKPFIINHRGWLLDVINEYQCGLAFGGDFQKAGAVLEGLSQEDINKFSSGALRAQKRFTFSEQFPLLEKVIG